MALESIIGTVMRRQSGIMDMIRDVRDNLNRIEKTLNGLARLESKIGDMIAAHDKWERKRAEAEKWHA